MHHFKLIIIFLLFSTFVKAQSGSMDPYEIVNINNKKVTKTVDTSVQYVMYDPHGNTVNAKAKVQLSFARDKLVAAQHIFDGNYQFENYFYYFNMDQLIMIQYSKNGGEDLYVCAIPNCMISKWDLSLASAIITSFSKMMQY